MKLFIINPDYGMTEDALRRREKMLSALCNPGTEIHMQCLQKTKVEIDSLTDVALASPEVITMAYRAQQQGYDAVVLYCFSDPAIAACRELLKIPVVGAGQTAALLATSLGYRFSLLTTTPARNREKMQFIQSLGISAERLASVRSVMLDMSLLHTDKEAAISSLTEAARLCVEQDSADTVVLGCLSFAGLAEAVSARCGVPVVDAAFASVLMAQSFVSMNLSHSKAAYAYPPSYHDIGKQLEVLG